jgi:ketosteroid isomerase-like protein
MERSDELKQVVLDFFAAFARGDAAYMDQMCSRQEGVVMFGTDPQERWSGHETILHAFRVQAQELGGGLPIRANNPQAFALGSVGWADDQPIFDMGDGQQFPARFIGVFEREGGEWKMVQGHLSLGVSNQEAVGQDLTV